MSRRANVFTIPAGTPFLATFVAAFRSGVLFDRPPLAAQDVAAARIFVPSRRAAAALLAAFAETAGGGAILLPQVLPLGDEGALAEALPAGVMPDDAATPVIGDLDRRLELFKLVDAWRRTVADARDGGGADPFVVAASRADAFALAGDLARLIDETIIEDVPLARLASGVPDDYRPERHSGYWSLTETFIRIAAEHYPALLAERGLADPVARLNARLRAYARHLAETTPQTPFVIAGSTGSVAATAGLMGCVARLPAGAVVLPGLDGAVLNDSAWASIGAAAADLPTRYGHPQALLKRTLGRIGIARGEVRRLPADRAVSPRERLLAEMFRPAETTGAWHDAPAAADGLAGLSLLTAADEREEAVAVALMLRETLETPGRTAALVTPDRGLARAVRAEMGRWGVVVADSAGEALASTPAATLARLALAAAAAEAGAVDVLSVLRHPLALIGGAAAARDRAVDAVEIGALGGKRLRGGVAGLALAVRRAMVEKVDRRAPQPRQRLAPEALEAALAHAEALAAAFAPFRGILAGRPRLRPLAAAHRALVEALLAGEAGRPGALEGEDGLALAQIFDAVAQASEDGPALDLADYARIFDTMLSGEVVHPRQPGHPRLKIWGLLEARLLDADRVILSGLDEGVWPPEMRGDPFLNRPMRIALGLQPPERRIGQTAHDVMLLLGGDDVVLTRAERRGGAPTIASRFLRRLTAYAGEEATAAMGARGAAYLGWARRLDRPDAVRPFRQPAPVPPAALTPERLSLTEIETLYRDPYAIFARRILRLDPLPDVDPPLDARDRGNVVHEALSRFTKQHAAALPPDAQAELLRFGAAAFAELDQNDAEAVQFWRRRFRAFVPWFVDWDRQRRERTATLHSEIPGAYDVALPHGRIVTLSARADRVEVRNDGSVAIVDYKTGTPPGVDEVLRGLAPQLPLTAALAGLGAFPALGAVDLGHGVELTYLHVARAAGGGRETVVRPEQQTLPEVIAQQFSGLREHLRRHVAGEIAYLSRRIPKKARIVGDYDHLARHLEWALGGEEEPSP